MRARLLLLSGSLAALGGACGEGGDDGPAMPAADCKSRCETKLAECAAPETAASVCAMRVCAADPTESQLRCAERAACEAFLNGTEACGIGSDDTCPSLTCDCPPEVTGSFRIDGRCLPTCEDVCAVYGDP